MKSSERPIAIDLFAGAGGMSLGIEQAGFDVAAAVEIDPVHAAVHEFNFPDCAVIPRSIVGLSGKELRRRAGLEDVKIDLVAGGPPCQGFSLIGKRAFDDPRNSLVQDFVRLVKELDASYFVFENVKGLTVGKHKQFLNEVVDAFEAAGYRVRKPWRVLNSASYGVPQDRERLFLMGAKRGLPLPDYPNPTTLPAGSVQRDLDLPYGPTCRDAIGDIPDAEGFEELRNTDVVATNSWGLPSEYARALRCERPADWGYAYRRIWTPNLLTSSIRTDHSEISRRRFSSTAQGGVEPISRFFRLSEHGISNTLRAGTDSARGAFTSPRPIHFKLARCITVREMARLHGFPDWFRFHKTKWHGARQIGNAVAPPLAKIVGQEILKAMGVRPERPKRAVELGDSALLALGMAEASRYWGVPAPIGKRDKKSGARKRSQAETEASLNGTSGGATRG